jgi:hypothetical protein
VVQALLLLLLSLGLTRKAGLSDELMYALTGPVSETLQKSMI